MSNQPADDQPLTELRRESEALRQIAPAKRAQTAQPKHKEYVGLIAKATASAPSFEQIARELDVFPPGLVGQALGRAWELMDAAKRGQVVQRLRALDADRHGNEGLPLGIQLL